MSKLTLLLLTVSSRGSHSSQKFVAWRTPVGILRPQSRIETRGWVVAIAAATTGRCLAAHGAHAARHRADGGVG